jgi:hypothetical protein
LRTALAPQEYKAMCKSPEERLQKLEDLVGYGKTLLTVFGLAGIAAGFLLARWIGGIEAKVDDRKAVIPETRSDVAEIRKQVPTYGAGANTETGVVTGIASGSFAVRTDSRTVIIRVDDHTKFTTDNHIPRKFGDIRVGDQVSYLVGENGAAAYVDIPLESPGPSRRW